MKSFVFALFVVFCACTAFAGEPTLATGEPQSVVVSAPAAVEAAPASACDGGNCCSGANCTTERSCRSSCRPGLFGRTIERTRAVTRTAVEVPVRVVAAPVRALRGRCGCCCR